MAVAGLAAEKDVAGPSTTENAVVGRLGHATSSSRTEDRLAAPPEQTARASVSVIASAALPRGLR